MKRGLLQFAMIGLALTAASGARAAPVTQDNFLLKTTGDLVALCGADKTDSMYTAAINFCHGFGVGTYRMVEIEEAALRPKRKSLCTADAGMSREQAMAGFASWAADKPKTLASPPSDGFTEYLLATFPCKK